MMQVRQATGARDIQTIQALEIKAQEFPMTLVEIDDAIIDIDQTWYMVVIGNRTVGCGLVKFNRMIKDNKSIWLKRICSHPDFRLVGVSRKLLDHIIKVAWAEGVNEIRMWLPEYKARPGDPDDVEQWLWKMGFRAGKVAKDWYGRYCTRYDAYEFKRAL